MQLCEIMRQDCVVCWFLLIRSDSGKQKFPNMNCSCHYNNCRSRKDCLRRRWRNSHSESMVFKFVLEKPYGKHLGSLDWDYKVITLSLFEIVTFSVFSLSFFGPWYILETNLVRIELVELVMVLSKSLFLWVYFF
jgi:hypothetical protein